ncbi:MAG: glycosyltransferase family 4 protein [Elusimicrobiota bacterium]
MNILLVNHFPLEGSGSGIYMQNIARELTEMGHCVMTITPEHAEPAGYPFTTKALIFKDDNRDNGSELDFNFPCFTTHPVSSNTFYSLSDAQIKNYVDIYRNKIKEGANEIDADIIHCGHIWVAPYCAAGTGIPYVITCHGTDLMGFKKDPRYRNMALAAFEKADRIIAISRHIQEEVIEVFGPPAEKTELIYNGLNDGVFNMHPVDRKRLLSEFSVPEYGNLIVFVGKMTWFKGVDTLLRAAALYEKKLDSAGTLVIGQGELMEDMQALALELGLNNVHFLGQQPQETVSDIYNAADLAVVPSRREPFGLVAVEALACGTPVVGTDDGGLVDFINEEVGALVGPDSPEELADTIVSEIESEAKKNKGAICSRHVKEKFLWRSNALRLESIYKEIAGKT